MVKLTYQIGKQKYRAQIPTAYSEISIGQLLSGTMSDLTGIPVEHLEQFPDWLLQDINNYLLLIPQSGIETECFWSRVEYPVELIRWSHGIKRRYTHSPDYGELLIGQFEDFKAYTKDKEGAQLIPYIMAFLTTGPEYDYTQRLELLQKIEQLPASLGMAFLQKHWQNLETLGNRFVFLFTEEADKDQELWEQAGGNTLKGYGFYGDAVELAGQEITRIETILTTLTVNQVYYHFSYLKARRKVEKEYHRLKEEQLKREAK